MLRWRLIIGLVSILMLLLAAGGYSIWLISNLGMRIDSNLRQNYETIRQAHLIRLRILRLNAYYMRPLLSDVLRVGPEALHSRFLPGIDESLNFILSSTKSAEEKAVAAQLASRVQTYLDAFQEILSLKPGEQARFERLRAELLATNLALTEATEEILKINEQAMIASNEDASELARDTVWFMAIAMSLGIAVLFYSYQMIGQSIVRPIEELTASLEQVRNGSFDFSLPVKSQDELGLLAGAFNSMASQLKIFNRETDETIVRLNQSLRETITAFPYPVLLLEASGAIWATNPAAESFLKSSGNREQLPDGIRRHVEDVFSSGEDYLPESLKQAVLFRIDEREVHFLPRILRIFGANDLLSGAAVLLIDVSRFRWLDDMKSNLISTISHEIKTPLTGIRMILHLLLEKNCGDLSDIQDEMVQSACDDCERLLRTLNTLLDLSRLEAGRMELALAGESPASLLEECAASVADRAHLRGISCETTVEKDIPRVLVDRQRISHVLGNFASNALKFAPDRSTITFVAIKLGADFVRLSVIDEGPGIAGEYHARIFEKFFRPPGQKTDGVGLGLSIAREIVNAHDGRIGVQSAPGIRTEFYCDLPIA